MHSITAKLVSQSHNLRTGEICLHIELNDQTEEELVKQAPGAVYADPSLFDKFDVIDRERIAFWAGVEHAKAQMNQIAKLKQMAAAGNNKTAASVKKTCHPKL